MIDGGPLEENSTHPLTLIECLHASAAGSGREDIVHIGNDGIARVESYGSLLNEALCVCGGLQALGLKAGDRVILSLDDTPDVLPALWGCMLGGIAPVLAPAPGGNTNRNSGSGNLLKIWKRLGKPHFLTNERLKSALNKSLQSNEGISPEILLIDGLRKIAPSKQPHPCSPGNIAVVMLSSGSTGEPKAIPLSHQNILRRTWGSIQLNGFSSREVSLNWMPLDHVAGLVYFHLRDVILGCRQVHAPTALFLSAPLRWLDWIQRFQVTVTFAPNFACALLNEHLEKNTPQKADLNSLRYVLNGAEPIVASTARRLLRNLSSHGLRPDAMRPAWGMSETSSGVTYSERFSLASTQDDDPYVHVGAPIPGIALRIVNEEGLLIEEGIVGELQVRGETVFGGYLGSEAPPPFTADGWFRTGDQASLQDGQLTITGRGSDLIILNGLHYHSHEIERLLGGLKLPHVIACAVRNPNNSAEALAIFFTSRSSMPVDVSKTKVQVRNALVENFGMIPHFLIHLEELSIPRSSSGKVLRPDLRRQFESGAFQDQTAIQSSSKAPESELETRLLTIWRRVLGKPELGTEDNFFEFGGDSIHSVQIVAQAFGEGLSVTVETLFRHPTVAALAACLDSAKPIPTLPTPPPFGLLQPADRRKIPEGVQNAYPLAKLQIGMLFQGEYRSEASAYHPIFSFHLQAPFDHLKFDEALQQLAARHPALRTSFDLANFSEPLQRVHTKVKIPLLVEDLRNDSSSQQKITIDEWIDNEKNNNFDWSEPPLLRFQIHRRSEKTFQLTYSCHHAILDGWSMACMLTELLEDYLSLVFDIGQESPPSKIGAAWEDFLLLEESAISSGASVNFWKEKLRDFQPIFFPKLENETSSHDVQTHSVTLPTEFAQQLHQTASKLGVPLKSLCLAGHQKAWASAASLNDITAGLVCHGRLESTGGDRLLGLFLNTLPFRTIFRAGSWRNLVTSIFEAENQLLAHRRFPLSEIMRLAHKEVLFEAGFNFNHFRILGELHERTRLRFLECSYFEFTGVPLFTFVVVDPFDSKIEIRFDFDPARFRAPQIEAFGNHYLSVLETICNAPESQHESFTSSTKALLPLTTNVASDHGTRIARLQRAHPILEQLILGILRETLDNPNLMARDDFFDAGADSLIATRAIARIQQLLMTEIPVRALMEAPTASRLSLWLLESHPEHLQLHRSLAR